MVKPKTQPRAPAMVDVSSVVAEVVECPWALILQPVSNAPLAASSMAMPGFQ
jgi:hypothetical protein